MADPQPIALDPFNAAEAGINLDEGQKANPISEDTAKSRADKIQFGLGSVLGEQYKNVQTADLMNGQEPQIRSEAAATVDSKNAQIRQTKLRELASLGQLDDKTYSDLRMPQSDPNSVVEEAFSHTWLGAIHTAALNLGDSFLKDVPQEYASSLTQLSADQVMKSQMIHTAYQDATDAANSESFGRKAFNFAMQSIPFVGEIPLRGNVKGVSFWKGIGLGENLEESTNNLMLESTEDFKKDFPRVYSYLKEVDPGLALQFLQAMHGYTQSEKNSADLTTAMNAISFPGVGAVAKGIMGDAAKEATQQAVKDLTSEAFRLDPSLPQLNPDLPIPSSRALTVTQNMPSVYPLTGIVDKDNLPIIPTRAAAIEAAGDVKSAALERFVPEIEDDFKGSANPTRRALETLPSALRIDRDALATNPGNLSREQLQRLQKQFEDSEGRLIGTIRDTMRVARVPLDKASRAVIQAIQEEVKGKYPGVSNRVLDLTSPYYEPISNTWHMGMDIGDVNAGLFATRKQAEVSARMQDLFGYEVRQKGLGFYLRVYRPLDETSDAMRDFLTPLSKTPGGLLNALIGRFRTPEDTMSRTEMQARKAAIYPEQNYWALVDEENKNLRDFEAGTIREDPVTGRKFGFWETRARSWRNTFKSYNTWKEWKQVLSNSRDLWDISSKTPGYTFQTPGELQDFYMSTIGRLPSYPEVEAYFTKKRLDSLDWTLRNTRVYTTKAARGTETWRVFTADDEGKPTYSEFFDGTAQKELPGGNFGIAVIRARVGNELKFHSSSEMAKELKDSLNEDIKSGKLKVIRVWAPEQRPLSGFGSINDNHRIRYVITKNAENHPLTWNQVPRRGGGHFDYDYDHYIKQANMRKAGSEYWYEGDTTVMPVAIRKMGLDIAKKLDNVRLLLKAGKEEEARVAATGLDIPWDDLRGWFKPGQDAKGKYHAPYLSLDEPFQVVPKDRAINDMDANLKNRYDVQNGKEGHFRNGMKEGSENAAFQVQYTGERDNRGLFTLDDQGTRNNPLYKYVPAQLADPLVSMRRGLNKIIKSTFMDDYKLGAIERLLREAEPYMSVHQNLVRSTPFWYFHKLDENLAAGLDPAIKSNLLSNWKKIKDFVGQPTAFDVWLHRVEQSLSDWSYDTFGPKGALVPSWLISHTNDPIQFARRMTYHAKLGLWNPAQWFLQNQTWTNIYGISPRSAPAGSIGTFLHWWAEFNQNPEILNYLDQKASALNMGGVFHRWKPGEWKEAFQQGLRSGFFRVDPGQLSLVDSPTMHQFTANNPRSFLSLGDFFFKGGIKNVRAGAWYTAFKEWRNEHPTGPISQSDLAEILDRADTYHANMTRASSSNINRGAFSLAFQFQTYPIRLAELFMGKRLGETTGERALARFRLASVYTALYGIPGSVGLTGFPLGDYFRQKAKENGYIVGDNWMKTAFMEGIPSMMTGLVFGENYNFGEHFGAHGYDALKEALRGDYPWWSIVGGSALQTSLGVLDGATNLIKGVARPDYSVTLSDWVKVFQEISSVNQGWKFFNAAKFGEWLSKNEGLMKSDVSAYNAAFMSVLGVEPQAQEMVFPTYLSIEERKANDKNNLSMYLRYMERGFRAGKDNDFDLASNNFRMANKYFLLLPENTQHHAQAIAGNRTSTIADALDYEFYIRMAPADQRDFLREIWQKMQQNERNK